VEIALGGNGNRTFFDFGGKELEWKRSILFWRKRQTSFGLHNKKNNNNNNNKFQIPAHEPLSKMAPSSADALLFYTRYDGDVF
jgi:hypothetical protein